MSDKDGQAPSPADFAELLRRSAKQQLYVKEKFREKCRMTWSRHEHLDINSLRELAFNRQYSSFLSDHPLWILQGPRSEIDVAFDLLKRARFDALRSYGEFHALLAYGVFSEIKRLSVDLTQHIFQFAFAASALVQAYRRFESVWPSGASNLANAKKRIFSKPDLQAFVQKVRNCYGHASILVAEPRGSASYDEQGGIVSSVEFDRQKLLALDKVWNKDAKYFIKRQEKIDVLRTINDYFLMAEKFYFCYESESGLIFEPGFTEINRCIEAIEIAKSIISLRVILQTALNQNINPFRHLKNYFSPEELRRISTFEPCSKEQINYMISLRDPIGLADESFINELHKLFQLAKRDS